MENNDVKNWFPEFQVSAETDEELGEYFFTVPEINQLITVNHGLF